MVFKLTAILLVIEFTMVNPDVLAGGNIPFMFIPNATSDVVHPTTAPSIRNMFVISPNNISIVYLEKPAGTASNDILVTILYADTTSSLTVPTGFTQVSMMDQTQAGNTFRGYVFWKRAGGSEPAEYAFTFGATAWMGGVIIAVKDAATSGSPFSATSDVVANSSSTSTPSVSATSSLNNSLVLWVGYNNAGTLNGWTPPPGYAEQYEINPYSVATVTQVTAGSTGGLVGTNDTSGFTAAFVGILTGL